MAVLSGVCGSTGPGNQRHLKPNTIKANTIFQGLPSNKKTPAKQRAQKIEKRKGMVTSKANISFKIF
jgi:hypothetical protein